MGDERKQCKDCKKEKLLSEFPTVKKANYTVLRNRCTSCFNAWRRDRYNRLVEPGKKGAIREDSDERPREAHPISVSPVRKGELEGMAKKLRRPLKILFVPDTHAPYHDKKAWALMIRAGEKFKPDVVVTLGDFADFYSVSSHDKRPDRARVLKDELQSVFECLDDLQALGAARYIYVGGNHEDRYDRYIYSRASEFYGLLSLPDLLKLKERGWEWVPYKAHIQLGKLFVTHECGNAGADAHKKAQATFEGNIIIGHTHRIGYTVVGTAEGKPHVGAMFGWLGDFETVDYMHRIKAMRDWAHGFGIGYLEESGAVHLRPVPIVAGAVVIDGEIVK